MTDHHDTDETRQGTTEVKVRLEPGDADRVRAWARAHLAPDPHGDGPEGDAYRTTTLYLDTPALDTYHRRGSHGRAKFRVRRYNAAAVAFLERKMRRPGLLVKWRTLVPLATLGTLPACAETPDAPGYWFARRVASRGLVPACLVGYRRLARQGTVDGVPLRLTLDDDLRAWPTERWAFDVNGEGVAVAPDRLILELKHPGDLPPAVERLLRDLALSFEDASKYRLATEALAGAAADDTLAPAHYA